MILSLGIRCWSDLVKYGAQETLDREYGQWVVPDSDPEKEQGYDITLRIDLEKAPEEGEERDAMIDHLAYLKPTILSAPFQRAFEGQQQLAQTHGANFQASQSAADQPPEAKGELMIVKYREEEAIYIQPSWDRVTVVFSTVFREETDRVFGKVFLQVRQRCFRGEAQPNSRRYPPAGIRRRAPPTVNSKCTSSPVLKSRAAIGDQTSPRSQAIRKRWLRDIW